MNTQHKKFLTILAVVALHAAVITLMLAQHGCKSDGAKAPAPAAIKPAPAAMPAPVAADNDFVAPTRPPPETPATPIPAAQFSEPLTSEPAPVASTPAPTATTPPVTWVVAKGDSLNRIAAKNGITVDELVAANAPKITRASILRPGESLVVPAASTAAAQPTASAPMGGSVYTVVAGDSLSKIAAKNGTTIAALKSLNKLTSNIVRVGQKLNLPEPTSAATGAAAPSAAPTPATVDTSSGEYTIVAGDTLSKIASKTGVKLSELMSINNLTEAKARSLRPGQKLQLPSGAHTPDMSAPATPTVVTPVPSLLSAPPADTNVTGVPAATTTAPITPVQ